METVGHLMESRLKGQTPTVLKFDEGASETTSEGREENETMLEHTHPGKLYSHASFVEHS